MKRILITGGAGFIGSHILAYLLEKTDWDIVTLDRYDTSGTPARYKEVITPEYSSRVKAIFYDLKAEINEFTKNVLGEFDYIVHLAASSHVDRSIKDPVSFVQDNVVGTANLLFWAKNGGLKKGGKFLNFSTDEVFGPAPDGYAHKEEDPHYPSNPYSASKSGQEAIGYAFFVTYGLPVITTRTMNNFGRMQHPEKLVPKAIRSVIEGTEMPIFARMGANGQVEAAGTRFWLNTHNTADAVLFVLNNGVAGEFYHIIGFDEFSNLEMCEKVATIIGKPLKKKFVNFYGEVRPGHDRRYALDGTKLKNMGWVPIKSFEESLKDTVKWTVDHPEWC